MGLYRKVCVFVITATIRPAVIRSIYLLDHSETIFMTETVKVDQGETG